MSMFTFLVGVVLLHTFTNANDVPDMAVLIGGLDSDTASYYKGVDVYTTHLTDDEKKCETTGNVPTIPDLPFGTSRHNAIYLPNYGIYICGWISTMGLQTTECWNYNPEVSSEWIKLDTTLEAAIDAAIIMGTSNDTSNTDAFWIMGGENYQKTVLKDTMYLDVSDKNNKFQDGVQLPIRVYGHCALNVKFSVVDNPNPKADDDYFQAAIMMGGYEGKDRFRVDSTDKTYAYCKSHQKINETICSKNNTDQYGWSEMPPIQSIKYGKKGFGHTYCTQFIDETLCDGVCIIAHGTWNEFAEYFPLERCAKTGNECEGWKNEINGDQIDVNSEADHALGGMTTLNNVPTLFLPLYDSNGPNGYDEKWTDVFQFKNYKWERIEKLDNSRGSFVPISVPKDFLCTQPTPTTTNDPNSAIIGQRSCMLWIILWAYVLTRFFVYFP